LDYLDRIPNPTAEEISHNFEFNKFIEENFRKGINLVAGGKIFGVEIDTCNLDEVIAALYVMYTYKEYLVKTDDEYNERFRNG
jgi:hypothetical protein